jgi:D-tyrosyl-tRNA(Tyr) deacylase
MIALIQRVTAARVEVDDEVVGAIGPGLLCFVGVERGDSAREAERLVERVLGYRVFADAEGKMNLSLAETAGGLLLVSQFTLAADTQKGLRPSFTPAAPPEEGRRLFDHAVAVARTRHPVVATGRFGAHMKVHLVNDGPVTFSLRVPPAA